MRTAAGGSGDRDDVSVAGAGLGVQGCSAPSLREAAAGTCSFMPGTQQQPSTTPQVAKPLPFVSQRLATHFPP
jgi:hypothetical protein